MRKYVRHVTELIGDTPVLELVNYNHKNELAAAIFGKVEAENPGGSVKDRVALAMIDDAVARGVLLPGGAIIEPTSGNTGIGLAMVAADRGYDLTLTMPETMSVERRKLLEALGATIVLTPGDKGMKGSIEEAERLRVATPGAITLDQFSNPANPRVHYETTGPEIWREMDGAIDYFVAAVGTGGTISGVGRFLKQCRPEIQIVAVEPAESPVLEGGKPGPHIIQGIGAGFVPKNYDPNFVDRVIAVKGEEAVEAARQLADTEGLLCGFSSGAALFAATKIAREIDRPANIVVLLPDTGERYLSTPLFG